MKKNRMMRLASSLLVLTLLTTSIISGTFAKYVTTDSAEDTARVAKWGVTALVSGSLFGENYVPNSAQESKDEISATAQQSVDVSSTGGNIVAPGTRNTEGLTLSVTGTPEVANTVAVSKDAASELKDIVLKTGSYATLVKAGGVTEDNVTDYYAESNGSYTKVANQNDYQEDTVYYELHDSVTLAADYYPIDWTLTKSGETGAAYSSTAELYTAIENAFNTAAGGQNNANAAIDTTYTVTWSWDFEDDTDKEVCDGADTILGNIIAKAADQVVVKTADNGTTYTTIEATDYCTEVAFNVTLTVTQVD